MRRPLSIRIISLAFLLAPVGVLLLNSVLSMIPLYGPGSIWVRMSTSDILILLLYPIVAVAIYLVRPWGWWFILGSALVMIIYNVAVFFQGSFASPFLMISMNLGLFLVAAVFFRKHIIAPYFAPQLRWWEQDQRYDDDTYIKVLNDGSMLLLENISRGGCFAVATRKLIDESKLFLELVSGSFSIRLIAQVVRVNESDTGLIGYGLMFTGVSKTEAAGLEKLLKGLTKIHRSLEPYGEPADADTTSGPDQTSGRRQIPASELDDENKRRFERYSAGYDIRLSFSDSPADYPAGLIDISSSGCAVRAPASTEAGQPVELCLNYQRRKTCIPSQVIWNKREGQFESVGIQFVKPDSECRRVIKSIISEISAAGGKRAKRDKHAWYTQADRALASSPVGFLYQNSKDESA